jgi:hypothetical protein
MNMNKFLKVIWSINGVAIFLLLLIGGIALMAQWIASLSNDYLTPSEVIVGKELEEAKAKGVILQGLDYDAPKTILHTDHYLLPVGIKTFRQPKAYVKNVTASSDYEYTEEITDVTNIVFLDKTLRPASALLDKKAFITSFRYPSLYSEYEYRSEGSDTLQRHITYLIAFADSNSDGAINDDDATDLYISSLEGQGLHQVTRGADVVDYSFLNTNEILIQYHRREQAEQEHKTKYFSRYDIREKKLEELTALHDTLKKIETQLTQ